MNLETSTPDIASADIALYDIALYEADDQVQQYPAFRRLSMYAGRAAAGVGLVAATACGANTVTVSRGGETCVSIESDASATYETSPTQKVDAQNLDLDGLVANATVKVSDRVNDISYSITAPKQLLDESFRASAKGGELHLGFECPSTPLKMPKLPEVVITMPEHGAVDVNSDSVGDTKIGNTYGSAHIENSGTGDVTIGDVAKADLNLSGTGNINVGTTKELSVDGSGTGNTTVQDVSGQKFLAKSSGTGNVDVKSGTVNQIDIESSGTGDVTFGGSAKEGRLISEGTGDVHVGHVDHITKQHADGTGDISVG